MATPSEPSSGSGSPTPAPAASAPLAAPRRTSPWAALFVLFSVDALRAFIPAAVVLGASANLRPFIVPALIAAGLGGLASWWRRTWSFDGAVFAIDEGVFVRKQRRIPVERVQHVEIQRRVRHRVFGLATLRIETAGGGNDAELSLDAIPVRDAQLARDGLRSGTPATLDADRESGHVDNEIVRLDSGQLVLAALTGPEVAIVAGAFALIADSLLDIGIRPDVDDVDVTGLLLAAVIVIGVVGWLAVSTVIGIVRRWGLTARLVGDELRVTFGLLTHNEYAVNLDRVQEIRIAHRLVLAPFRRADVRIRSAASGSDARTRVDIPALDGDEIERLLGHVLPDALPLPALDPAPGRARRRVYIRSGLLAWVAAGALTVAAAIDRQPWAVAMALVVTALGLAYAEAAFRALGHRSVPGEGDRCAVIHTRLGALNRAHTLVAVDRVQSCAQRASWFQRRRRLQDGRLDLAGSSMRIRERDPADLVEVCRLLV